MSFLPGGLGGSVLGGGVIALGANTSRIRGQTRAGMQDFRREVQNGLSGVTRDVDKAARGVQASSAKWNAAFGAIGMAAKVGLAAVVGAVGGAVAASMQFESSWAGVRKTMDATPEQLAELRQQFRDLAKEIPVSVNELAKIGETAGALGIARESVLDFTKTVALIGQTTNVTTEDAATSLGQLSNVLRLSGKDYGRFADTLVDLGNKGASTEKQILEIASRAGSAAGLIGMSTQQMLAFASATASLGIEVEAGGSSLQNFFLKMNKYVGEGGAKLKLISEVAGVSMKDFAAYFEEDAGGALALFVEGLGRAEGSSQQMVLELLKMNDIRITRMLLGLANGGGELARQMNYAEEAWNANSAATEEFGKRAETTATQMGLIKNIIHDYMITLGDSLLPTFKVVVDVLKNGIPKAIEYLADVWNRRLMPPLSALSAAFLDLFGAIALAFGSENKPADWMEAAKVGIEGIASAVGALASWITPLVKGLTALASNPIAGWFLKVAAAITAARVAWGLFGQLVGRGKGLGRAIGGALGGVGRAFVPQSVKTRFGFGAAAVDPELAAANAMSAAANETSLAARETAGSARALNGAAAALRGAAGADVAGDMFSLNRGPLKGLNAIRMVPGAAPGLGVSLGGSMAARERARYYGTSDPLRQRAMAQAAQAQRLAPPPPPVAPSASGFRGMLSGAGGLLRGGLSIASRAFWPLLVGSIAVEFLKQPISDIVVKNTQFKRAGAKMADDFWGGLIDLMQSNMIGTDAWVGRAETMTIAGAQIKTMSLAKLGIGNATFDKLEAEEGTIDFAQGQKAATETLSKEIARKQGEAMGDWIRRIQDLLPPEMNKAIKDIYANPYNWEQTGTRSIQGIEVPVMELTGTAMTQLEMLLGKAVGTQVDSYQEGTREAYIAAVGDYLKGRGFSPYEIEALSTANLATIAAAIKDDVDGRYGAIMDYATDAMLGAVETGPSREKARLSADSQASLDRIKDVAGKNWEKRLVPLMSKMAQGRKLSAKEKALAAKMEEALGKTWRDTVGRIYSEINPDRAYGRGGDSARITALKEFAKKAKESANIWSRDTPEEVRAVVSDMLDQTESLDPGIIKKLKTKFGADWLDAFRTGAATFDSKKDRSVIEALKKRFGEDWQSRLQALASEKWSMEGGKEGDALRGLIRRYINDTITLVVGDGSLRDITTGKKVKPKKARRQVARYLDSDTGKAALTDAASEDATKAAEGMTVLMKGLSKAIPNEGKRKGFINTMVEMQRTMNNGNLGALSTVWEKAGDAFGTVGGAVDTLKSKVDVFAAQAATLWNGLLQKLQYGPPTPKPKDGASSDKKEGARGLFFDTMGATHLTVGEAGKETVAVLRNPRKVSLARALGGQQQSMVGDVMSAISRIAMTNPRALPWAKASAGLNSGPRVQVMADKLQLLTPADRRSVHEQLAFLAPDGR